MLQYEDIYIKICDDFSNELNPLLMEVDQSVNENYWFDKKSIQGKFIIIYDLLIGSDKILKEHLYHLTNLLSKFKARLEAYFLTNPFATGFLYLIPVNEEKTREYFEILSKEGYCDYSWGIYRGLSVMTDLHIEGFPNDCYLKLTADNLFGETIIKEHNYPIFDVEIERGKLIGDPLRTQEENLKMESDILKNYPNDIKDGRNRIITEFVDFSNKVKSNLLKQFTDFDNCLKLIKSYSSSYEKESNIISISEAEKIFNILNGNYIDDPFDKFFSIFRHNFTGNKLTWLKSGPELKYFVNNINGKLKLSNQINKWTSIRFIMSEPVKNMSAYLSKQSTSGEYYMLKAGNKPKDPLYKLFRE